MRNYLTPIFLLTFFGVIEISSSLDDDFDRRKDLIIWPIIQVDGIVRRMTLQQAEMQDRLAQPDNLGSTNSDRVRFFLYTQTNPLKPIELDMRDAKSIRRSTFNSEHPTRFMIHGWNAVLKRDVNDLIREALLLNGEKKEFNFIKVDWSAYSTTSNYIRAKNRCLTAGKEVAQFIDWMHDNTKLSFDTVSVYGHSLGAHVAGFTGKNVKRGRINTIIGLDPAMPLYQYKNPDSRLANTDAEYVETIHTNAGWFGFYEPIGQIAFYPNGGKLQPGCGRDLDGLCSHLRSVELLSEALSVTEENRLLGFGCEDLNVLKKASCGLRSTSARLGDPKNANKVKGIYYLETNGQSPFGLGL